MEKKELNRLIGEFMGWKYSKKGTTASQLINGKWSPRRLKDIRFDTSWDWLMPVTFKIEDLGYSIGYTGRMSVINSPKSKKPFFRCTCSDNSRIENLYNAIVQFITWYNTQTLTD